MVKKIVARKPEYSIERLEELALQNTAEPPGMNLTMQETREFWFRNGFKKALAAVTSGFIMVQEEEE